MRVSETSVQNGYFNGEPMGLGRFPTIFRQIHMVLSENRLSQNLPVDPHWPLKLYCYTPFSDPNHLMLTLYHPK